MEKSEKDEEEERRVMFKTIHKTRAILSHINSSP